MRASGPFDVAKYEARLNLAIFSIDRRVLNLAGAASGIDFDTTVVNSTNLIEITNGGSVINASGLLDIAHLRLKRAGQTTPTLEFRFDYGVTLAEQGAQIRQCQLTLAPTERGKNELKLTGAVNLTKAGTLTGHLKLAADTLDATRYYDLFSGQPTPAAAAPTATAPAAPPANVEPAPMKLPFDNFTLEASVGKFYLREVAAENFQFVAKLDGSHVVLQPAQLTLNGAPITATADLDLSVPGYKYDVTFSANGVPVEPLANSFSPTYRGQAKGRLIASAQLKGAGVTGVNLKQSLAGTVNFSFTNANIQIVGPKIKAVLTPIALVLGAPELLSSPMDYINASLHAAGGKIEVPAFIAHSAAFRATSAGVVPIADVLMDSPLNQNVDIALAREVAGKLRFSNAPTNEAYATLPTFARLNGTLGEPKVKTDKLVIVGLTAAGIGGALGNKAGGVLQNVGGLLGGNLQPAATGTNAATTNPPPKSPVNNLLDIFGKKPKK